MAQENWDHGWERLLWKQKSYPDNFVPKSFLSSLRQNPNFRPYTYLQLVISACAITQHLSTIIIFLDVFARLYDGALDARILIWASVLSFGVGFASASLLDLRTDHIASLTGSKAKTVKSSILVFLALMSLSPVLRTLTAATSSDSIWALSACLFVLNALLADYTALQPELHRHRRLTSVLSMNAAISSAVVLASRLPSDLAVFALLLMAIQLFALFPPLRRRLQTCPVLVQILITTALGGSSLALTLPLSTPATILITVSFIFVTFVAPGVLVWAQKYKNEIRGTWDPAVPKINNAATFS
ncbi:phosphatidylinositol N-acetylglucosaminyltransferase [Wolfiporia cocos MD-104 SS10]|uniref:Phosphatidylinositol N-acetylglucosaminyltransferase n=1 Tax=Wolfiporia cocos (strain MD-104) TaxID=742152 RepID=A0A2H3IW31_WOLCO|nr:phosphatidylinositol N-acetylglucosaminyltransferase [Wolfiporia cocos MD-104 SS10]